MGLSSGTQVASTETTTASRPLAGETVNPSGASGASGGSGCPLPCHGTASAGVITVAPAAGSDGGRVIVIASTATGASVALRIVKITAAQ